MSLRIHFDFYGDAQVDRTLERFELGALDARPAFEVIRQSFLRAERRQFASEGGYGSGGWAPLSASYAEWKARHYPGRPILEREGDLKRSLTEGPAIAVIEPHFAVLGSDVDYGRYHQRGAGRLPKRPPVELPDSLRRNWVKTLQRWIVTGNPGSPA